MIRTSFACSTAVLGHSYSDAAPKGVRGEVKRWQSEDGVKAGASICVCPAGPQLARLVPRSRHERTNPRRVYLVPRNIPPLK